MGPAMIWSVVESSSYFVSACLPRLRIVLRWFLEKTRISEGINSAFGGLLDGSKSSKDTAWSNVRSMKPFHSGSTLKTSDDVVGLVELDERQHGNCETESAHHHVDPVSSSKV